MAEYLTSKLWDYVENSNKKLHKKIFNILNEDRCGIICYDNNIYIEKTYTGSTIPDYFYNFVKKWAHKNNYKFYGV